MPLHGLSDRRSLVLHGAVAQRLREDPSLLERARERVEGWGRSGSVHPDYVQAWRELLASGAGAVLAALEDESERGQALRQVSPFAGVLSPRERWALLREANR